MSRRFERVAALALCLASAAAAAEKGGYDEGYRHGFQDGYRQGLEAGRAGPAVRPEGPPRRPLPLPVPPPEPRNILVIQADYGSGGRTCDATDHVAARLNGKRSGTIEVGNRLCGDPAPGSRKYLRVLYLCGGEQREVVAFERRALDIRCD